MVASDDGLHVARSSISPLRHGPRQFATRVVSPDHESHSALHRATITGIVALAAHSQSVSSPASRYAFDISFAAFSWFWVLPAQPSILSALASRALPKSLRESAIPLSNQEHSVLPCQSAHNMRHNLGAVARSRVIQLSLSGVLGSLPRNCLHTSAVTRKPNLLTAGPVGVPGTRTSQSAFSRYRYHRPRCQRSYCT